ncbi:MAG: acyl-CoA dehydrogenase [Hyphomonadaceae bacterium]|nr:acyl-CoA dehydrogenase [Hyphomonadaceae bacterium]
MHFELAEDHRMLADLVARFVADHLLPLEPAVLARDIAGQDVELLPQERARLDKVALDMGLWGLDAPVEMGGADLPWVALVAVNEQMGRTIVPYTLRPDSPNLRMLMATCNDAQREQYLAPYARGETISAIAISEPGAGSDPAGMITRAERDGDGWVLNGRKIWTTRAAVADFTIVMAVTDKEKRARGGMSAFLVDKGTPGFNVLRKIPMLGGETTYEVALEDCRVGADKLLGTEGQGFAPMQIRLNTRRLQMACWGIGLAQRALDMMVEYAPQRSTFGAPLSERQTVQNWVAEAATKIHAGRLMAYEAAWRIDQGRDARTQVSMVKAFGTELGFETVDRAMQLYGAMGMTREMPLQMMLMHARNMRIYDGPTEIHHWVVARDLLGTRR